MVCLQISSVCVNSLKTKQSDSTRKIKAENKKERRNKTMIDTKTETVDRHIYIGMEPTSYSYVYCNF